MGISASTAGGWKLRASAAIRYHRWWLRLMREELKERAPLLFAGFLFVLLFLLFLCERGKRQMRSAVFTPDPWTARFTEGTVYRRRTFAFFSPESSAERFCLAWSPPLGTRAESEVGALAPGSLGIAGGAVVTTFSDSTILCANPWPI